MRRSDVVIGEVYWSTKHGRPVGILASGWAKRGHTADFVEIENAVGFAGCIERRPAFAPPHLQPVVVQAVELQTMDDHLVEVRRREEREAEAALVEERERHARRMRVAALPPLPGLTAVTLVDTGSAHLTLGQIEAIIEAAREGEHDW